LSRQTRSGEKLRQALRKKTAQQTAQTLRLGFLISILLLVGFALSYKHAASGLAQETQLKVKVTTLKASGTLFPPVGNIFFEIGPYTGTTGPDGTTEITVAPGTYQVKAFSEGCAVIYVNSSWASARGEARNELDFRADPSGSGLSLSITLSCSNETVIDKKEKSFRLFVISEEGCKNLQDVQVVFDREGSVTRLPLERLKDGYEEAFEPGTYEVSIAHTIGHGSIQAELLKVRVSQRFKSSTQQLEFPADESGKAKVNLERGMWVGANMPEIGVYVTGLCGEVGYIDNFSGEVWIDAPNETSRKATYRTQVRVGETIRTLTGSSVDLKTYNNYLIKIGERTTLRAALTKTATGIRYLERFELEFGNIQIIRLVEEKTQSNQSSPKPSGINVKTPTATITDKETNYTVSYNESSKSTTVGVVEGKVEIVPINTSLQPVTLAANQQIQVTENNVSSITAYTPNGGGGNTAQVLLYVGIGVASLLALAGLLFFFRRQHRRAMQPASHWGGMNPAGRGAPPAHDVAPPVVNQDRQSCPNPQCGKELPSGQMFCAHCGTRLNA